FGVGSDGPNSDRSRTTSPTEACGPSYLTLYGGPLQAGRVPRPIAAVCKTTITLRATGLRKPFLTLRTGGGAGGRIEPLRVVCRFHSEADRGGLRASEVR